MSETIWVMESDVCDICDSLLDYFGLCPNGCLDDQFEDCDLEEDLDPYNIDFDENGRYIGG